jgi:hypothetical protein
LDWKKIGPTDDSAIIKVDLLDQQSKEISTNYLLLAHGFFNFSELPTAQTLRTPYVLPLKAKPAYLRIQLLNLTTVLTLAADRSVQIKITASHNLGPAVVLPVDK